MREISMAAAVLLPVSVPHLLAANEWVPLPEDALEWKLEGEKVVLHFDLPHPEKGYYRGLRFEGSGIVARAEWEGHSFFTRFRPGEATRHDNTAGTAEEFDIEEPATFASARPGEPFLKIGVGILQRPDDKPYKFFRDYPVKEKFPWQIDSKPGALRFRQSGKFGDFGYAYTKVISLSRDGFLVSRELTNTGRKPLHTNHYGHNFILIDEAPPGPGYEVELPWPMKLDNELPGVRLLSETLLDFSKRLDRGGSAIKRQKPRGSTATHRFVVRNQDAGVVVDSRQPITEFALYLDPDAICPEPFQFLDLEPGETAVWETEYIFFKTASP